MPGVEVTVSERCLGCGACTDGVCFVNAIQIRDGRANIDAECRGCGRCVAVCPNAAITLSVMTPASIDQTILQISQKNRSVLRVLEFLAIFSKMGNWGVR
jgi:heterodisulfide reductase subunit A-like polyferredoxin